MSRTEQVDNTDSINSQDPARDEPKKAKSKRPPSKKSLGHARCSAQATLVLTRLQILLLDNSV